jgi:hypothetical protein
LFGRNHTGLVFPPRSLAVSAKPDSKMFFLMNRGEDIQFVRPETTVVIQVTACFRGIGELNGNSKQVAFGIERLDNGLDP